MEATENNTSDLSDDDGNPGGASSTGAGAGQNEVRTASAIDESSRLSVKHPRKIVVHELPKKVYRTPGKNVLSKQRKEKQK